jgi:hypothetical protein
VVVGWLSVAADPMRGWLEACSINEMRTIRNNEEPVAPHNKSYRVNTHYQ